MTSKRKYALATSAFLSLSLLAACSPKPNLNLVRPMTHQDITAHNAWVRTKQNAIKPTKFKGVPINVKGTGRLEAIPNIAVITGVIETKSKSHDGATDKAARIINAVQESLKGKSAALNFTDISSTEKREEACERHNRETSIRHNDIVTDNQFNQRIKNDFERGVNTKSKPRAPKSRKSLKLCPVIEIQGNVSFAVRVTPADLAPEVIKLMSDAGIKKVDLFGYDYEDYDALYQQAAVKAVSDAKRKAELISQTAGTQLLELSNFTIDPPQRTSRFGPQAIIISNHGNRTITLGRYNNNEAVINSGPQVQYHYIPPVYETYTETIVVQEASTELVTIPATYETISETVVVQPEYTYPDGTIIPAVTKQVARRVVKTPASTQERIVPSVAKQETRRRIKEPGRTIERVVPSTKDVNNAVKISLAGKRTITVNAALTYNYETPIDGTLPPKETSK